MTGSKNVMTLFHYFHKIFKLTDESINHENNWKIYW